ncbi:MAG: carboxylating nicotinate-nucleotide diphosphorylase [Myxococcota bacterium]
MVWHDPTTSALIDLALREDLGTGDVTTLSTVSAGTRAEVRVVAKEPLVVAGLEVFTETLRRTTPDVEVRPEVYDGAKVAVGDVVARASGAAAGLLMGERVALNFLQRLSGVATLTRTMAEALGAFPATRLVDTRKTTPGMRSLEKAAVRAGGGHNHRFGLADGVLIKDNHIAAAGGITAAVARARQVAHHLLKIEVETTTLDEVQEALSAGADVLLLDNMSDDLLRQAVALVRAEEARSARRVLTEASGNMGLARLPQVGAIGVDFVSVGALTHSARAVDLSMKLELLP